MKKRISLVLVLASFTSVVLAPPQDKAEKLRHDGQDWDRESQQFVIKMSCKFGLATAGEHADFKVSATLLIDTGDKTHTAGGERDIQKVEGASKDADGYVAIEPTSIAWDRQGFAGDAGVTASLQLIGPSGKPIGEPVIAWSTVHINPPDSPGPVAHWTLDDGEGAVAVDSSGNGNDGILMGDPQWAEGKIGGALDFDGDGDYVDCGTNDILNNLSEAMTASAWVSIRSVTTTWMAVMTKGETAWRISVNGDTTSMHFGFLGGDQGWQAANSASELLLDEWHHVAATYDSTIGALIYIDGVVDGSNPGLGGIQMNEAPFLIGENPEAAGRFFDGLIDDVRIYNAALSAEEIAELAQ